MKTHKDIEIVSVEYTKDETSKNKLVKLVIDCLLDRYLGGEQLEDVSESKNSR